MHRSPCMSGDSPARLRTGPERRRLPCPCRLVSAETRRQGWELATVVELAERHRPAPLMAARCQSIGGPGSAEVMHWRRAVLEGPRNVIWRRSGCLMRSAGDAGRERRDGVLGTAEIMPT